MNGTFSACTPFPYFLNGITGQQQDCLSSNIFTQPPPLVKLQRGEGQDKKQSIMGEDGGGNEGAPTSYQDHMGSWGAYGEIHEGGHVGADVSCFIALFDCTALLLVYPI